MLIGGKGADLYYFSGNSGRDLILGFSQSDGDKLNFGRQTYSYADDGHGGTQFTLSGGGTVDVAGVATSGINQDFFA